MAVNLCGCTAPRCMTPTQPMVKRKFKPAIRQISSVTENTGTDSRYTSTRSEDLREIQKLFRPDEEHEPVPAAAEETKENDGSTISSKHSKIASFFRRRLSRTFSKSKLDRLDPEKLKEAKNNIKSNLLNEKGPEAGGYDADASELDNVDAITIPTKHPVEEPERGRSKARRHSVHHSTWSGPSRLSIDFSPPRLSFGSHGYHRRSHSMYSLGSADNSEPAMRLPSFSGDRDTSYAWKKGVMDSLQIQSPSSSNLITTPVRRAGTRSKRNSDLIHWPLREETLTLDSEAGMSQGKVPIPTLANEVASLVEAGERPSEDIRDLIVSKQSLDHGLSTSHYGSLSSSSGAHPHFFGRPERRPPRASSTSVHLYSMGISKHLRSTSMTSSSGFMSKTATRAPTAAPTRSHSPVSLSQDHSRILLAVEDLPPLPPSTSKMRASSEYSLQHHSRSKSPAVTPLPAYSNTSASSPGKGLSTDNQTAITPNTTNRLVSDSQTPKAALSAPNLSTSNLSEKSQNSSKVSRFKEEFDTGDKKTNKRRSIVNMFNQLAMNAKQNSKPTRRKKTESVSSLDGAFDEPRRLQRAMALTDQNDAAGLLAKAIRDKQAEKASLYLKANKEAARHEIFRQRSSSFCRPHGDSVTTGCLNSGGSRKEAWHRRSTSETVLRPDASMPTLQVPHPVANAMPRAHSTGHLTPEFRTPVFSDSKSLTPGRDKSQGRNTSISIDPAAQSPTNTSRRSSYKSRDPSATINTSALPFGTGKRKTISAESEHAFSPELNDANLGAWSRYPSHTREERTGSAGTADNVKTRDFAYDINPLNVTADESDDYATGAKSKKLSRKKKRRTGTLPKSRSMIFGGLRNYAKLFGRSSSAEYLNSGRGHRSSISAGGELEHPELELLPPVFAPMPTIADKRPDEEDPGLAPDARDIELQQMRHRRLDHGNSFTEPSRSTPSRSGPPGMDGAVEPEVLILRPDEARRIASSPALVSSLTAPGSATIDHALHYAQHYESCVLLPPSTSHSTMSHAQFSLLNDSNYAQTNVPNIDTIPHSPSGSNLIDKMLASPPGSANISPLPSPVLAPVAMPSIGEVTNPKNRARLFPAGHGKWKSVSSVQSLRASSMDLLKALKDAEEKERQRVFEALLCAQPRASLSEERAAAGGHQTWPGSLKCAGGVTGVEAA